MLLCAADKVWVRDPDGVAWEYYTVVEDAMIPVVPRRFRPARALGNLATVEMAGPAAGTPGWLRLAWLARALSWLTLGWLGIEAGVAIGAAVIAGSVALLGFGLDSGIEALASIIVIWRFTGTRLASPHL